MLVLIPPIADEIAEVVAIAAQHGWPHRSGAVAAAAGTDDEIVLHAPEAAAAPDSVGALLGGTAPVIALASADWIAVTDWAGRGYVAVVDRQRLAADLPGAVADWSHAARLATIDRLAATFGSAPVARLLQGLRDALLEVLPARDEARLLAEAHRLAGLAGTLGFAAVGQHWLRVAQGEHAPNAATRRATAHALATLDRVEKCALFTIS